MGVMIAGQKWTLRRVQGLNLHPVKVDCERREITLLDEGDVDQIIVRTIDAVTMAQQAEATHGDIEPLSGAWGSVPLLPDDPEGGD